MSLVAHIKSQLILESTAGLVRCRVSFYHNKMPSLTCPLTYFNINVLRQQGGHLDDL